MAKNTGRDLIDKFRGTLDAIPAWARRFVKYTVTKTKVDAKVPLDPPAITGVIVASQLTQEVIDERLQQVTELDPADLPVTRTGQTVLETGLVGTVTETVDDAPQVLSPSATLEEGSVENVGNISLLRKVESPSVFDNTLHAKQRPDTVPEKFRAAVPATTTRVDTEGLASPPTLVAGDLERSSEQLRYGVKRDAVTNRPTTALPVTLVGQEVTSVGQLADVNETLDSGDQIVTPSALLVEGRVENLGNGLTLRTTKEVPGVFPATQYTAERPEVIPQKFRAALPLTSTRVDSAGTASAPVLGPGVVSASSEQVTAFVKRDLTALRNATALPVVLTGQELTPDGQVAAVTETLAVGTQTIAESATTVEAVVDNIGDGLTVKTEKVVGSVFGNSLFAKERPDVLPPRFRVAIPAETTRLDTAGTAAAPTLGSGDVEKISEQVRVGVRRDTTVTRNLGSPPTLPGSVMTTEFGGDVADVIENIVVDTTDADAGVGVISSEVEALGDGNAIKRTVQRSAGAWPTLTEYEPDPRTDTVYTITKTVVDAATVTPPVISGLTMTEYKALDKWRSIQIVTTIPSSILGKTIVHNITARRSFPPEVERCEYKIAIKRTNFTAPGSGNVNNEVSSFDIALDVSYRGGYSGIVEARLTETFTTNPESALPAIFKYYPQGGTLCLGYTMSGISLSGANVRTFVIQDSLHGELNPATPNISNIVSGATIVGQIQYSAITWDPSDGIPASSPTSLNGGAWIVDTVGMEKWRCGVFVKSVLEVKVPDFP